MDTGKIIGILRSLLYFAAGIFFVVSAAFSSWVRLFGIMAIAYGAFRLYQSLRKKEEEEDDDEIKIIILNGLSVLSVFLRLLHVTRVKMGNLTILLLRVKLKFQWMKHLNLL